MRRVDKLGRIVIPANLRQKYGLTEGTKIEILDVGDGIAVKASECFCKVCHGKIPDGATLPLCDQCIAEAVKHYHL